MFLDHVMLMLSHENGDMTIIRKIMSDDFKSFSQSSGVGLDAPTASDIINKHFKKILYEQNVKDSDTTIVVSLD